MFGTFKLYSTLNIKNPSFLENNSKKIKSPSANAKGLEIVRLPQQNDFRTFCMSEETERVHRRLEEIINTY